MPYQTEWQKEASGMKEWNEERYLTSKSHSECPRKLSTGSFKVCNNRQRRGAPIDSTDTRVTYGELSSIAMIARFNSAATRVGAIATLRIWPAMTNWLRRCILLKRKRNSTLLGFDRQSDNYLAFTGRVFPLIGRWDYSDVSRWHITSSGVSVSAR